MELRLIDYRKANEVPRSKFGDGDAPYARLLILCEHHEFGRLTRDKFGHREAAKLRQKCHSADNWFLLVGFSALWLSQSVSPYLRSMA